MSDCKICFNKDDGKVMRRNFGGECDLCNPNPVAPLEDACVCPPLGEPKFLPIIAPVVFDECGINLCREIRIPEDIIDDFPTATAVELKVIDVDFNFDEEDGSRVETISRRPNCVKVRLARLCVKFIARFLDSNCRSLGERSFSAEYLPESGSPSYDEDTNPSSATIELYAPYGVSYIELCGKMKPSINFLGFVDCPDRNNDLRQGINVQMLAKVLELDLVSGCMAVGLTIYLKSVYFVQYKIKHAGLCVPPKCIPIEEAADVCKEFVEGDLLEQSIQPLEVCTKPKTISCGFESVEDPTPALPIEEEKHEHKRRSPFSFSQS